MISSVTVVFCVRLSLYLGTRSCNYTGRTVSSGLTCVDHTPAFSCVGGLNSGPPACVACTLPTEAYPQSSLQILVCVFRMKTVCFIVVVVDSYSVLR